MVGNGFGITKLRSVGAFVILLMVIVLRRMFILSMPWRRRIIIPIFMGRMFIVAIFRRRRFI